MTDQPTRIDIKPLSERLVRVQVFGMLDGDEASMLMDAIESNVAEQPHFLLLAVISEIGGATAAARRTAADRLGKMPPRSIAIVGGSFAQRITAKLVLTALKLLGNRVRTHGQFFDDEQTARAWLDEQAAQRDAGIASES